MMRETKLKKTMAVLTAFTIVIIVDSASVARESRKGSSSRSSSSNRSSGSSRSSGNSRSSSGGSSSRNSSSSSSSRSYVGSASRSSSSSRGSSGRTYRKATPSRSSISPSPGRISTSRSPASGATPILGGASGRISRKQSSRSTSPPAPTPRTGRIDRKYYTYSNHPPSHRSLYHYHDHHYPSHRVFYWVSWPDCCRPICYSWGPYYSFGAFWPYYHRRFVFVSLGGYWPYYNYRRYYWYGWHPHRWYGYHPPGYVIAGDTYNYYYYNDPPDSEDLEEARKEYEQVPRSEPAEESQTDRYFEQGVEAFEAGDYAVAAQKFHEAQQLTPNDIVLPFARVQALFAATEYHTAAAALREALALASPDKEGVFYPRGLYPEESLLLNQIEQLSRAVQLNPANSDLRLLLGYQQLGIGKLDDAVVHLQYAELDAGNKQAATLLLRLLDKLRRPAGKSDIKEPRPAQPKALETPLPAAGSAKATPSNKGADMLALAMAADNWLAVH